MKPILLHKMRCYQYERWVQRFPAPAYGSSANMMLGHRVLLDGQLAG
jgi:hypothetical protein